MITLRDFMETVDYRITEGSQYGWQCYGPNAYALDSWDGNNDDGHTVSIVFDTKTQTVYEMTVCDYKRQRAYRWINPDFREKYMNESDDWDVDDNQAWDDVKYVDLDVEEDMLEKTTSIVNDKDYDTRIQVVLELEDDLFIQLAKMAHKNDITINQMVEQIIRQEIERKNA